jgi:hypothetical protein
MLARSCSLLGSTVGSHSRSINSMSRFHFRSKMLGKRDLSFQSKGILGKLARLFDTTNNASNVAGARALINIVSDHSTNPVWHNKGLVGTDFRSIHALKTLHLWIIHKRLIKESTSGSVAAATRSNRKGELIQESLFDEFWDDTIKRIRAQGVVEISVNKNLQEIQKLSFRFCLELDEALDKRYSPSEVLVMSSINNSNNNNNNSNNSSKVGGGADDMSNPKLEALTPQETDQLKRAMEEAFRDKIGGIIWRNLFMKKAEIPEDHVIKIANYVIHELDSLLNMPSDIIFQGMFEFSDTKLIFDENLTQKGSSHSINRNNRTYRNQRLRKDSAGSESGGDSGSALTDSAQGHWKAALASDGRTYYWNTVTRESRWDLPKSGK